MRLVQKFLFRNAAVKAVLRERELLRSALANARQKLQLKDCRIKELQTKIRAQNDREVTPSDPSVHQRYLGGILPNASVAPFSETFLSKSAKPSSEIAIFVKSYSPDFQRLAQLVSSYRTFANSIPFVLSVPAQDLNLAKNLFGSDVTLVADEEYTTFGQNPHFYGWLNQQLCKLSLFKLGFSQSYFVVDSDCYFLRDIGKEDFIHESGMNYSIFSRFNSNYRFNAPYFNDYIKLGEKYWPSPELDHVEPALNILDLKQYISSLSEPTPSVRGAWIRKIFGANHAFSFMPCPIVNSNALQSLHDEFCIPNALTISDLIAISPWEFNWYGEWLLYRKPIPLLQKDPIVAHFPSEEAVDSFLNEGFTASDLASRFSAVAMASQHYERTKI